MKTNKSELPKGQKLVDLGKKDGVFQYNSNWPIFVLHKTDPNGIWTRLQNKLNILEYQNILQELPVDEVEEFLNNNPDIDLELNILDQEMPDFNFFKYNNKIYCYTIGKKGKDKNKFFARFYFDLEEII
jgi:hypothetical protein